MQEPARYEWDEEKRRQNLAKHGLDFSRAYLVCESPLAWDFPSPRANEESRRCAVAFVPDHRAIVLLAYVRRGSVVRCISFRRASRAEREAYRDWTTSHPHE